MFIKTVFRGLVFALIPVLHGSIPALPQDQRPDGDQANLEKATQNPVANLIGFPLQNNLNFNIGPARRTQDVLNIQPVIPISLTNPRRVG